MKVSLVEAKRFRLQHFCEASAVGTAFLEGTEIGISVYHGWRLGVRS